jgi:predicted nucleotide-binding protein
MDCNDLDRAESENIAQLRVRIAALQPNSMPSADFLHILLQRYWVSQEFTHVYDVALDRLELDNQARPQLRRIIREEYPNDRGAWITPSHREDLVTDLFGMGITPTQFKASRPSLPTQEVMTDAKKVVYDLAGQSYPDVRLLSFLRTWGEVLTAIEYEELYPRIEKSLGEKVSVFYLHHLAHDSRLVKLSRISSSVHITTHADQLGEYLIAQATSDPTHSAAALAAAQQAAEEAARNKLRFWAQFSSNVSHRRTASEPRQPNLATPAPQRVFISHGRSQHWRAVQDYIENDIGLETMELAQEANRGLTVIEKLFDRASHCDSAVIVMTGDDMAPDGPRVRENVMHEIGLFQGKYGRQRVVLLHEEGVSIPTNLSGVVYIPFPKQGIEAGFYVLQRELKVMYALKGIPG